MFEQDAIMEDLWLEEQAVFTDDLALIESEMV